MRIIPACGQVVDVDRHAVADRHEVLEQVGGARRLAALVARGRRAELRTTRPDGLGHRSHPSSRSSQLAAMVLPRPLVGPGDGTA
jgi:hypothetical protein